jgi:acetyltransferase-like isoleucine patch superfamily enzyme
LTYEEGQDVNIPYVRKITILNGQKGLEIGKNVLIEGHCYLVAGNHDFLDMSRPINQQDFISKGIHIKENVWRGAGVKVLDGVRIGSRSVVSTGTVVTKNVPSYSIMAEIPAKVVRKR